MNHCGIQFTGDSEYYVSIAKSFNEKNFHQALDNQWLIAKPPLYPFLLSIFQAQNVYWFNFSCFLLLLGSINLWSARNFKNQNIQIFALFLFALATPVLMCYHFLWTEAIFIPLLLLYFIFFQKWLSNNKMQYFVGVIFLANLLSLIRHVNIFIIIGMGIGCIILLRKKRELLKYGILTFLSSFSFIGWQLFKSQSWDWRTGQMASHFSSGGGDFYLSNAYEFLFSFGLWFLPNPIIPEIRIPLIIILTGLFVTIFIWIVRAGKIHDFYIVLLVGFVVYWIGLHMVFRIPELAAERYLAPFYVPVITLVIKSFQIIYLRQPINFRRVIMVIFILWLGYSVTRTFHNVKRWHEMSCEMKP